MTGTEAQERENVQRTRGRVDQVLDEIVELAQQARELLEAERQGRGDQGGPAGDSPGVGAGR